MMPNMNAKLIICGKRYTDKIGRVIQTELYRNKMRDYTIKSAN